MVDKQFELASDTWGEVNSPRQPTPEEVMEVMVLVFCTGFPEYTMSSVETYFGRQGSDPVNQFEKTLLTEVYVPGDAQATHRNVSDKIYKATVLSYL